jgi:hypothetical protein
MSGYPSMIAEKCEAVFGRPIMLHIKWKRSR